MNKHRQRTRIRNGSLPLEPVAVIGWAQDETQLPAVYDGLKLEMARAHGRRIRGRLALRAYEGDEGDEAAKALSALFEIYAGDELMLSVVRRAAGLVREHGGLVVTCTARAVAAQPC